MKFKLTQISDKIYHLHFNKQIDLTTTFIRFSEYCESPKFKGKVFSLNEFKSWYKKLNGKRKFTYFKDVSGFNIPSSSLKPFINGKFDPLSPKEKTLLRIFKDTPGRFCIIGTYSEKGPDMAATLKHEIAHGLFYTNKNYRKEVKRVMAKAPLEEINLFLKRQGYSKSVWLDEAHAFIMCDLRYLKARGVKLNKETGAVSRSLKSIFKKYYKERS